MSACMLALVAVIGALTLGGLMVFGLLLYHHLHPVEDEQAPLASCRHHRRFYD